MLSKDRINKIQSNLASFGLILKHYYPVDEQHNLTQLEVVPKNSFFTKKQLDFLSKDYFLRKIDFLGSGDQIALLFYKEEWDMVKDKERWL